MQFLDSDALFWLVQRPDRMSREMIAIAESHTSKWRGGDNVLSSFHKVDSLIVKASPILVTEMRFDTHDKFR